MHSIIIFIAFAIVSQYNVFGASFYDDAFNFQRRADAIADILSVENVIIDVATPDQITQLKKLLPVCAALSTSDLQGLVRVYGGGNWGRRRKRSLDFLRRLQDSLYEDEQNDFDRRASDADKKIIADYTTQLLKKLDQDSLNKLSGVVKAVPLNFDFTKAAFVASVITLAGNCGKKVGGRSLEVLNFLEEQMMNQYN